MRIEALGIVHAIGKLPKDIPYNYINPRTTTKIIITDITYPEGPIKIRRYDPQAGEGLNNAREQSISTQMIWRIANAINPNHPINFDRILGASYNTRSAFEALLAHTPEFYYCFPGRIETISSSTTVKRGHKHLIWSPSNPHTPGVIKEIKTDLIISEIPSSEAIYEALVLPEPTNNEEIFLDNDVRRRHAQIQIALLEIGRQLGSRVWVAQNDKAIMYRGTRIGQIEGVIPSLKSESLLMAYDDAVRAALMIDCIWFRNNKFMPAVFEVEHSTGITSGLTRMKNFQDALPRFPTKWVIAAPDEMRVKVVEKANKPQFKSLDIKYFPYSAVEELYSLCQKRKIEGVTDGFLDCFMEPCVEMAS